MKMDEEEIEKWKEKYFSVLDKARFLDNHIAIVTNGGEKYHRYDCQYVKGKNFFAYNSEAAKSRGYTPCSVCNPPD